MPAKYTYAAQCQKQSLYFLSILDGNEYANINVQPQCNY